MAMEYDWAGGVRTGGQWFKELRIKRAKTLRDVDLGSGISQQNISNIENGLIVKPSMAMLVQLGNYYGVTPNEIARKYGWWKGQDTEQPKDERLVYLETVLAQLSSGRRYNLLQQVVALATLAEQEAKK